MATTLFPEVCSMSAVFSPCRLYRYTLTREFDAGQGTLNFIMLNPSTADETANDPTVERCERRAIAMGFRRLIVTNIFAFRSTDPKGMKAARDPVGPDNDIAIRGTALTSRMVIAAWGEHGKHLSRSKYVWKYLLKEAPVHVLKLNKSGEPKHPL